MTHKKTFLILPTTKSKFLSIGFTSEQFVTKMLEEAHVVVPPGNGYGKYGEGFFRIALTKPVDTLKEALKRMKDAGIRYE